MPAPGYKFELRSPWSDEEQLLPAYYGEEWSIPERDGTTLWEALAREKSKARFFWSIVPRVRDEFLRALKEFDPQVVAPFDAGHAQRIMRQRPLDRSRSKIVAATGHPGALLAMERCARSACGFKWSFVNGRPSFGLTKTDGECSEDKARSNALSERGYQYVGPVVVYASESRLANLGLDH
jgi:3-methyladenine DNA glycosylase Tag